MGSFAKVIDGKVVKVISAEPDFFESFVDDTPGRWIQTSYNTYHGKYYMTDAETGERTLADDQSKALRGTFAGIGYEYHKEHDIFSPPKPYASWTLDVSIADYVPPVAYPDDYDSHNYVWNEETQSWDAAS